MIAQIANNNRVASSPVAISKKYPAPQRPSIQELKQKYEVHASEPAKIVKPKSPKMRQRSMVKQMASMFNNKISQIIRRDTESKPEHPKLKPETTLPKPLPMPRLRHNKDKAPVPSPRTKSKSRIQKNTSCFVAEDVFAKLTVKDKALLYTQFVEDMSRKNPKFGKHAEVIEATVKQEVVRGEVVNEKQESVKQLLENLEARCVFPKQTVSKKAIQRSRSVRLTIRISSVKSKEFEDIRLEQEKDSAEKRLQRSLSLTRISQISLTDKQCHQALPTFATPKEIRLSRSEVLAPQQCLKNQQLEDLFYSWLKQRHDHEESQQSPTSELDEDKQKSAIDKLLEEAIAKLETVEIRQKEDAQKEESKPSQDLAPKIAPRKKYKAPAIPQIPSNKDEIMVSGSSASTSAKQSENDESESGISNLTKTTSDEDQSENKEKPQTTLSKEIERPVRPLRKKKMRRTLSWKKDSCLVETKPMSSTDSEPDCKQERSHPKKTTNNKPQPLDLTGISNDLPKEPSFVELDKSLMRVVNSPRKIKSAYTLTFSPPASNEESSLNDMEYSLNKVPDCSRSWSSLIDGQQEENTKTKASEPRSLADSFDQGFETGSNDIDSPMKPQRKSSGKRQSPSNTENPSGFSTPIKSRAQQNFNQTSHGLQQQLFSPISAPLKNSRRRSIYDNESRRSSLVMQVIREDHPLEHHELKSPRNLSTTEVFFANAPPTMDMTRDETTGVDSEKTSSFWIKLGDFSINLDVHRNEKERLKLLYEIFSQRSCDTKDMHFGIDGHKFSVHDKPKPEEMETLRLPQAEGVSQYWFSTGDLAIPFSGKPLSAEKIQRIFQFIKSSVEETGILRFGVDDVEFSNVPELWTQIPKFSMESNYSMLVGLQSGNSNGLEGRSKYAWPHSKPRPVSDLDQSDFECEDFGEDNESLRLSFSPFGSKNFDLACLDAEDLMMPRNSEAIMMSCSESFGMGYENEPLDQLFENKEDQKVEVEQEEEAKADDNISNAGAKVPEMLNTLQTQQERLTMVQQRLSSYPNPANLSCDSLEGLKGTPDYLNKLKSIISEISKIGCSNGFKDCSMADLERYMFFLSRYADICLHSCSSHMDKILDALLDHRSEEI